jgi:hypothetical protein
MQMRENLTFAAKSCAAAKEMGNHRRRGECEILAADRERATTSCQNVPTPVNRCFVHVRDLI